MLKKILLCVGIALLYVSALAQTDYSGSYGFSFSVPEELHPPGEEKNAGATGALTLFKIDSAHYKFWLNVNRGYPSYNMGYLDGIAVLKNNVATYKQKQEYADSSCTMVFTFNKNFISIQQQASDFDCGFGHNVFADGTYHKKQARKLTNAGLQKQYIDITTCRVVTARAYLFEAGDGIQQKKQYFIAGDTVYSSMETDTHAYVEYITASGKFIYGWLKKTDIKTVK